MIQMIAAVSFQCLLFAGAQLFLKVALKQFGAFNWSWGYFRGVLFNPAFMLAGICALSGTLLWMFILKKLDLSIAYPLTGISYIFGVMAAQWILHEPVPVTRWIGVVIIMIGVFFVVK
jgi:undecaprenyl phosphate-alpha-L-ara4N flippase subunit ArnE